MSINIYAYIYIYMHIVIYCEISLHIFLSYVDGELIREHHRGSQTVFIPGSENQLLRPVGSDRDWIGIGWDRYRIGIGSDRDRWDWIWIKKNKVLLPFLKLCILSRQNAHFCGMAAL